MMTYKSSVKSATLAALTAFLISGCDSAVLESSNAASPSELSVSEPQISNAGIGTVTRFDMRANDIIPNNAVIETLTDNQFSWSEGPVWIEDINEPAGGFVLFTDVPQNVMYKWSERDGLSEFLRPSGFDAQANPDIDTSIFREAGANGLIWGGDDTIIMGDHGNRAIMSLRLSDKTKTALSDNFQGRKFNSPNDVVLAQDGAIYFTDPPYGLKGLNESAAKELPFNGVYRRDATGDLKIIDRSLTFPNGVILSPNEKVLYVAVSDPAAPALYRYDLDANGAPTSKTLMFDFKAMVDAGQSGLPDGMAISNDGHLFATGPDGIHVFAPDGTRIANIFTGTSAANCTFGGKDGDELYITSGAFLARIKLTTKGKGF